MALSTTEKLPLAVHSVAPDGKITTRNFESIQDYQAYFLERHPIGGQSLLFKPKKKRDEKSPSP